MSYIGKNPKAVTLNLIPQNADPSNPSEGDMFESNGTPRTAGPWIYIGGAWQQISTTASFSNVNKITFTPQSSDPVAPTTGTVFNSDGSYGREAGLWFYDGTNWVQISRLRYTDFTFTQAVVVKCASTTNIPLANIFNGSLTIDGQSIATNDLILLKNQTSSADDGVYKVGASSGTTVRDTSADTGAKITNLPVYVSKGTVNANLYYYQTATVVTLGTDAQVWTTSAPSFTFTVPEGVKVVQLEAIAAGGGGGSGGSNGGGTATQGGGGGAGAQLYSTLLNVTAGQVFTVNPGINGVGGTQSTLNTGNAGRDGGNTTVTSTNISIYLPGASGGAGSNGLEGSAAPVGGSTYANNNTLLGLTAVSAGGAGAATGTPAGSNGTATVRVFSPASGGAGLGTPNRGCAGGGGGSGIGIGGTGAAATGATTGNNGGNAAASSYGAGGGGGSGNLSGSSTSGSIGGSAACGRVRFIY